MEIFQFPVYTFPFSDCKFSLIFFSNCFYQISHFKDIMHYFYGKKVNFCIVYKVFSVILCSGFKAYDFYELSQFCHFALSCLLLSCRISVRFHISNILSVVPSHCRHMPSTEGQLLLSKHLNTPAATLFSCF